MLGGCAQYGKFVAQNTINKCNGKGRASVKVEYGDSYIVVTPKTNVKPGGEFIYDFKPERNPGSGTDYTQVDVVIEGKGPDDQWLNKTAKFGNGKTPIFICVDASQAEGTYEFFVRVPGVGKIDPRAIVIKDAF